VPRLLVVQQDLALDFRFRGAITIGRHLSCSLPLPGNEVSRRHAQIYPSDAGFVISDQESRNGLYVNGRKCKRHALQPGDEIGVGKAVLVFDPPEGTDWTSFLSKRGRNLVKLLDPPEIFERVEVSTFPMTELDETVERGLRPGHREGTIWPPDTPGVFLGLALSLDRYTSRAELCRAGADFLAGRIDAARVVLLAHDAEKQALRTMLGAGHDELAERLAGDRDLLHIVLDGARAVFSPDRSRDYRFRERVDAAQAPCSFLAVPLLCGTEYAGFLYAEKSVSDGGFGLADLVQAHLTGSLLAKCLYWRQMVHKRGGQRVVSVHVTGEDTESRRSGDTQTG
jgi:hypothetical protein